MNNFDKNQLNLNSAVTAVRAGLESQIDKTDVGPQSSHEERESTEALLIAQEIEKLSAAIALEKQRPSIYAKLSELFYTIGRIDDSEMAISAGENHYKSSTYIFAQKGTLAFYKGDRASAFAFLCKALADAKIKNTKLPKRYHTTFALAGEWALEALEELAAAREWQKIAELTDLLSKDLGEQSPLWLRLRARQALLFSADLSSAAGHRSLAKQLIKKANRYLRPTLSVVIPVFQVEDYLEECLASVSEQTFVDLEVVMVDDGSTDGSTDIGYAWAAKDPRFRIVHQENGGLGHARNTGVKNAFGRFLVFLDSDDTVPVDAYEVMVNTILSTKSDFVSGRIMRFDDQKSWTSAISQAVHVETKLDTHVSQFRKLYRDLTAWNKLFNRDFYDRSGIKFPRNRLYEDMPTITPAHFLASKVDVIDAPVYNWRLRDRGESISQSKHIDKSHFTDRMKGVSSVVKFISEYPDKSLLEDYRAHALQEDIMYFVNIIPLVDKEYQELIKKIAFEFYSNSSINTRDSISTLARLKYKSLSLPTIDRTVNVIKNILSRNFDSNPYKIAGNSVILDAGSGNEGIVEDVSSDLKITSCITDISLSKSEIIISGFAYLDRVQVSKIGESDVRLWFEGNGIVKADVVLIESPVANHFAGQEFVNYEGSGFIAKFPIESFAGADCLARQEWTLKVLVAKEEVYRISDFENRGFGTEITQTTPLPNGRVFRIYWSSVGKLVADAGPIPELSSVRVEGNKMLFTVEGADDGSCLELTNEISGKVHQVPNLTSSGEFRVPLSLFWKEAGEGAESGWKIAYGKGVLKAQRLLMRTDAKVDTAYKGSLEAVIRRDRYGLTRLLTRPVQPRLIDFSFSNDAVLEVVLRYPLGVGNEQLVLKARNHVEAVRVPLTPTENGLLVGRINLSEHNFFGTIRPLKNGLWETFFETTEAEVPLEIKPTLVEKLPAAHVKKRRRYEVATRSWHRFAIEIASDLLPSERGKYNQRLLRREYYPSIQKDLSDQILFISYNGQQFSDSPRVIFDKLKINGEKRECLLVVRDQQVPLVDGIRAVVMWSKEYYDALATSKWIITNQHLPEYFEKREGQIIVQTWHGIGLKKVGLDIEHINFPNKDYHEHVKSESKKWDYLISPNSFNNPIMLRAFDFKGTLLETGIPRNDVFHGVDTAKRVDDIRARLGISAYKKVVLYAPTWRDNVHTKKGVYKLDLRLNMKAMAERLGDEYVLLMRTHSNVVDGIDTRGCEHLLKDVSHYNDMQELLLVADILVTDYSTCMFDFANTLKPMIFFAYDLENYRDELRGFYFDYESEVPGKIVRDEEEVFRAILRSVEDRQNFNGRYQAFIERHCEWDDGNAADRVVAAVFGRV